MLYFHGLKFWFHQIPFEDVSWEYFFLFEIVSERAVGIFSLEEFYTVVCHHRFLHVWNLSIKTGINEWMHKNDQVKKFFERKMKNIVGSDFTFYYFNDYFIWHNTDK